MPETTFDYDNSLLLDSNICIVNSVFEDAVLNLQSELKTAGKFMNGFPRLSGILKLIMANLYYCNCLDPNMSVAYSRTKNK